MLIYVIRHGQTAWNAERRLQGQKDIPMNATGLEQARQNGIALAGILGDTVDQFDFVASPLQRTRATMEIMMSTRDLVLTALFAAIIVALGLLPPISLGFIPVPITAQSLGVMMAGVVLGARRGAIAVLIVLVLVAIGLPVLSGGRGGLAIFASPTAGFLIGWIFAAFVTGYLSERLVNHQQSGLVQTVSFFLTAMTG